MATINKTAAQVLLEHAQREQLRGTFIETINLGKIGAFYENNGMRIHTLLEKENEIKNEFLEFNEDGSMKLTEDKLPVYREGKTKEDYLADAEAFYKQVVPIKI